MKTRKCRVCLEHKPLSQMKKRPNRPDGVNNLCKACRREQDYFYNHGVERPKSLDVYKLIAGVEHKRCPTCSEYKTYDNFYKHTEKGKGLSAKCKPCYCQAKNYYGEEYKARYRDRYKRRSDDLEDKYVRKLLCRRSKLKMSEFPQELVDVKREVIRIQRFIKENNV